MGETVAVRVMLVPTVVEVLDAASVVVVDVVLEEEVLELLPEPPQPARNAVSSAIAPMDARKIVLFFMVRYTSRGMNDWNGLRSP